MRDEVEVVGWKNTARRYGLIDFFEDKIMEAMPRINADLDKRVSMCVYDNILALLHQWNIFIIFWFDPSSSELEYRRLELSRRPERRGGRQK